MRTPLFVLLCGGGSPCPPAFWSWYQVGTGAPHTQITTKCQILPARGHFAVEKEALDDTEKESLDDTEKEALDDT
ncbi:MAG: hypothetical protein WBI14_00535, partial [Anaerolineaceae bacterium]